MLQAIADFDDALLEKLLEDVVPNPDEIYAGLARDLQQDLIVPVFFGSAEGMRGVTRRRSRRRRRSGSAFSPTGRAHGCSRRSTPRTPASSRSCVSGRARSS